MALNSTIKSQFLAALGEHLEFDDGEMDGLVASLCGIVTEEVTLLNERIAELESTQQAGSGKVKVKATRKGSGKTTGKKQPNAYSKFVKLASAISKGEDAEGKDIVFTPIALAADKAVARWSAAPDNLVDFSAEYRLEDLIQIVKGHDDFSNLMVASSLVWGMIPSAAKEQVTTLLTV